jgi:hypothetical protein
MNILLEGNVTRQSISGEIILKPKNGNLKYNPSCNHAFTPQKGESL